MDIIIRGMLPEEKKYVATCNNCGTRVTYKLKEVKVTYSQRDGDFHEFDCPVCSKKVCASPQPYLEPSYYNDH